MSFDTEYCRLLLNEAVNSLGLTQLFCAQIGDETQESFSCFLVQNLMEHHDKISACRQILEKHLANMNVEQHEQTFRQLLKFASSIENHTRMKWLFDVFHQFIENKVLSSRLVKSFSSSCVPEIQLFALIFSVLSPPIVEWFVNAF